VPPADPNAPPAEAKPEGDKPKEGDKPAEKAAVKPEDYKVTLPEGVNDKDPLYTGFLSVAAEEGVSPEVVQKVIDKVGPQLREMQQAPQKLWQDTQETWQRQIKSDPDIGGPKLEANLGLVAKFLDTYGGPEARQALDFTGAGNNPAIAKMLINAGRALAEGSPVRGQPGGSKKSAAELFYPNQAG
jgi:hypothetical protein